MNSDRKKVSLILGIMLLTSFGIQFGQLGQTANAEQSKRIVGYFPYWESADIDSIDYSKLTEIIYFHVWPNPDGTLDASAVNMDDLNTILNNAHASGVSVLIAVGGAGVSDAFPLIVSDNNARANFVANIAQYVLDNNLDGVDIDWETTIDQSKIDNQDVLLADLSNEMLPLGKFVTVAVNGEVVELKASAANNVDWVNVMAYDMNWGTAEHSTLSDSISALQIYESAGIPKEKLSLGIPFYGRDDKANAIKYEDIVPLCNPKPSDNYCNGYFFNGIDLVQEKVQYVMDNGYHGVMAWNLGQDTYDGTSLLNAINYAFAGKSSPDIVAHLEDFGITTSGNNRWTGTVMITVFDESELPVSGATVNGNWSDGASGSDSCITDISGNCSVSKSTKGEILTFTIQDISGTKISYDSSANELENFISFNKDGMVLGQNSVPTADAGGPYTGTVGTAVTFDGSGSFDPDGDSLTYLWDFGDGTTGVGINPSHAYSVDGNYDILLTVADNSGTKDTSSTSVMISSQEGSSLSITQISPNIMVKGDTITATISGTGFDPETVVKFGGDKWSPSVIQMTTIDTNTIKVDITRSTAGPNKDFHYDVSVTNINGDSFTLPKAFTVTSQ